MTHDEIIAIVQAHEQGKKIEIKFFGKKSWEHGEFATLEDLLITMCNYPFKFRISKPQYRAWRKNEVPEIAEYKAKIRNGNEKIFLGSAEVMATDLQHVFETYLYRTDLSKDEWFVCGVEIEEGEQP